VRVQILSSIFTRRTLLSQQRFIKEKYMSQTALALKDQKRLARVAFLAMDDNPFFGLTLPERRTRAELQARLITTAQQALLRIAKVTVGSSRDAVHRVAPARPGRPAFVGGTEGELLTQAVIDFTQAHYLSRAPNSDLYLLAQAERLSEMLTRVTSQDDENLPFKLAQEMTRRFLKTRVSRKDSSR
jgi:hypothetical protein